MTDTTLEINDKGNIPDGHSEPSKINARLAVIDNLTSIPRIIDLDYKDIGSFLSDVSEKVYNLSHTAGGKIPYTIIKEIIENLIHAGFKETTVTILEKGNKIIVSDQGPGIINKEKAMQPGYTTANIWMKKFIRGVGSGLPIVSETIGFSGGKIDIDDNLDNGTVVTLSIKDGQPKVSDNPVNDPVKDKKGGVDIENEPDLGKIDITLRQTKILSLILELEELGPSRIAKELGFSLSTSYRELVLLEKKKLVYQADSGKRKLTSLGKKYLEYYTNSF